MGISAFKIANSITSIMPDSKTIEGAKRDSSEFDVYMERYPELNEYSTKLQNLTRNWSIHAAGVVIGEKPLYEIAPLRIDGDTIITQWEKTRCEDNGLIKMDILGLKTLSVIDNTFKLIESLSGSKLTVDDIDLNDSETYDMIGTGKTIGVFQLESSLTPYCMKIKPRTISDISDINALGRPSCTPEQRRTYMRRRSGLEKVAFRHPKLERALGNTYGVSLYEESMMTIAKDCAGWDLNQADALRKITKLKGKDPDLVLRTEAGFIRDCMEHSHMKYNKAKEIWDHEIAPYGLYGFNRSHSVSYSHISFYTAWLRCHYPTEFMCALLNSEDPNSDKAKEYLSECLKMGIEILPPDVNSSNGGYSIIKQMVISTGFTAIKGIGDKAIENIIENKPFGSLSEFFSKTLGRVVNKRVVQSLSKAGALDSFGRGRKEIYENCSKYRTKVTYMLKKEKEFDDSIFEEYHEEWSRKDTLLYEKEILGRTISGSLHEIFEGFFGSGEGIVTPLSSISMISKNSKIKIEAIVQSMVKEFKIKNGKRKGQKFAKYLLEDVSGSISEMTVWPEQYTSFRGVLRDGTPIKAICKVDEYMGNKGISLIRLERHYSLSK